MFLPRDLNHSKENTVNDLMVAVVGERSRIFNVSVYKLKCKFDAWVACMHACCVSTREVCEYLRDVCVYSSSKIPQRRATPS